jgi:hypothetical protein
MGAFSQLAPDLFPLIGYLHRLHPADGEAALLMTSVTARCRINLTHNRCVP